MLGGVERRLLPRNAILALFTSLHGKEKEASTPIRINNRAAGEINEWSVFLLASVRSEAPHCEFPPAESESD